MAPPAPFRSQSMSLVTLPAVAHRNARIRPALDSWSPMPKQPNATPESLCTVWSKAGRRSAGMIMAGFRRGGVARFAILGLTGICGVLIALLFLPRNPAPRLWIESSDGFQFREWKPCLVAEAARYADFDVDIGSSAAAQACIDKNVDDLIRIYGRDLRYARPVIADSLAKDAAMLMKRRQRCIAGGGDRRGNACAVSGSVFGCVILRRTCSQVP
jgi:hypothetical protein